MIERIIESVEMGPAILHMQLGFQALKTTIDCLVERVADYKTQSLLATSMDII